MTASNQREIALLTRAEREAAGSAVTIFLRDLAVHTTIGVSAAERRAPRALMFDIDMERGRCRAGASDRVADTIDYAMVAARIRARLGPDSFRLLERVAECVADLLLGEFEADRVVVKISKPGILPDVGAVGVRIERSRA